MFTRLGGRIRRLVATSVAAAVAVVALVVFAGVQPAIAGTGAHLTVTISADQSVVAQGAVVTYTLTVANDGDTDVTGLVVSNTLDSTAAYDSVLGATFSGQVAQWAGGPLAAGDSWSSTFTADATASTGSIVSALSAHASVGPATIIADPTNVCTSDPTASCASTTINTPTPPAPPVVNFALTSGSVTAHPGDVVSFALSLSNPGASDATSVSAAVQLPPGLTFSSSTAGSYNPGQRTVYITQGTLAAGTSVAVSVIASVDSGATDGDVLTPSATVTFSGGAGTPTGTPCTTDPTASCAPVTVHVSVAAITFSVSGPATVAAGDATTFTIVVDNASAVDATDVGVLFTTPAGFTVTSTSPVGASQPGGLRWQLATVPAHTSTSITVTGTVNSAHSGRLAPSVEVAGAGFTAQPASGATCLTDPSVSCASTTVTGSSGGGTSDSLANTGVTSATTASATPATVSTASHGTQLANTGPTALTPFLAVGAVGLLYAGVILLRMRSRQAHR